MGIAHTLMGDRRGRAGKLRRTRVKVWLEDLLALVPRESKNQVDSTRKEFRGRANSHPKCNDVEKQKDITARSR